jgi:two-component system, OmpR family, response regulator
MSTRLNSPAKKQIVLLEPDPDLRQLVRMILEYHGGYRIRAYPNTRFYQGSRTDLGDLLILEANLEPIDGYALVRKIRQTDKTTPIILTTRDHRADKIAGMEAGAADYLPKPFTIEDLLARIRAAFRSLEAFGSGDR